MQLLKTVRNFLFIAITFFAAGATGADSHSHNPKAVIKTSLGDIKIELFKQKAPVSVKNFLAYIDSGFFKQTIFHRVIPDFMIQGGGFSQRMDRKTNTLPPIKNEANNGIQNKRGTVSMARTQDPNSATSQFFINVVDNHYLNQKAGSAGYAVFGKVIEGMEVVDTISKVKTQITKGMRDVPSTPVVIHSIDLIKSAEGK
ncbi:MAG: peptidylprolyl isomerase A [Proteobacteria bacterium]|nr:MAG: peptidylprolyl isomerase A [Pseudomonadota bacterium]